MQFIHNVREAMTTDKYRETVHHHQHINIQTEELPLRIIVGIIIDPGHISVVEIQ